MPFFLGVLGSLVMAGVERDIREERKAGVKVTGRNNGSGLGEIGE